MLLDGLIGAIIGAVVGALIGAAVSWGIFRSQRKEDRRAAAKSSAEERNAAAKVLRNDIARTAHLLIAEYQDKVQEIAMRALKEYNQSPDAAKNVGQAADDLISLSYGKNIAVQLEPCCPQQKSRMIELEDNKLKAIPDAYHDASKLFTVCTNLSEGLTSIRRDLADMIREV